MNYSDTLTCANVVNCLSGQNNGVKRGISRQGLDSLFWK